MLEIALSLFDYFIKLVEKKEGNIDEYFDIYVKPAFEIAQNIFSDYTTLLHTVKKKIQKGSNKRDIIEFLEDGRIKYLPLRRQLYVEVQDRWNNGHDFDRLPKFEKGLLGILMGGLSPFEYGDYDERYHRYSYHTPYNGGHTLLDLIISIREMRQLVEIQREGAITRDEYEKRKKEKYDEKITQANKDYYIAIVDRQINALEAAWQDVVEGYSEYKTMVAVKPAKVKKLGQNRGTNTVYKYKKEGD
jgi:hypothetical protein